MELMLVPVPLFDKYLSVVAYLFRYQLANQQILLSTQKRSPPLEALNAVGAEAFAGIKPILVPVSAGMLEDLAEGCTQPPATTTFYLEDISSLDDAQRRSIADLRRKGFGIAVLQQGRYIDDDGLLKKASYVLLGEEAMAGTGRRPQVIRLTRFFKNIRVVATGLNTREEFEEAKKDGFHLYEGMFYRVPVNQSDKGLNPIKANLIQLLNMTRDENFEFADIASIIRRDTALSYSMMRFINSPYLGIRHKVKSIQQAVTILGQIEVRKWITAAVVKALGSDRPDELTRVSLIRAKFAENLARLFGMEEEASSLFLMGLFSVLDVMLEIPMESVLKQVTVSEDIADTLNRSGGKYSTVLDYIVDYERADWKAVIGRNMVHGLFTPDVYTAYIEAISWYNEMLSTQIKDLRYPPQNFQPQSRSER